MRFGWLDFTDDREVSEALIDKGLYDFTILPDSMAEKYMGFYLKVIDPEYLSFLKNERGELVAFGITMPSIGKVLQLKNQGQFRDYEHIFDRRRRAY